MDTSYLCRAVQVIFISIVMLLISSCKTTTGPTSSLKDVTKPRDPVAQYNLGVLHQGKQTKKDNKLAAKYFREAAEQGYADAQFQLGWMFIQGKGVKQNDKQAAKWIRKAADQGHSNAQLDVGWLY